MVFRAQRRFIAGAVCPKCAVMDRLVVFKKDDRTFRECVSCGYHQEMVFSPTVKHPPTRFDVIEEKSKSESGEAKQEIIRIVT